MVGKSLHIVFATSFPAGRVRLLPAYKPNERVSFNFTHFSGILQNKMSTAKAEIDGVLIAEATAWETVEGNVYVGYSRPFRIMTTDNLH
jgi:hypothetical protein